MQFNMKTLCHVTIFILACIGSLCVAASSADKVDAPVIVIEPMLDRIGWYMSHKAYTFQTRLTAELFTRYQCSPMARSIGLLLHQERSLASIEKQLSAMPKPQWIVGGSYQVGRRINNKSSETDIELLIVDATTGDLFRNVFREKAGHYAEIHFIADQIAKKIKLSPKKVITVNLPDRSRETWAVLPFAKILSIKDFDRSSQFPGTDQFVYALMQSGKIGNIVSRENMQKILAEHNLHALSNIDMGSAALIGRLLSADHIVFGTISNGPRKDTFRIDILSVDCNSGVVVNAYCGIFTQKNQDEILARAADKILKTPDEQVPMVSDEKNEKTWDTESNRLFEQIKKARFQYRITSVFSGQILSLAESYYLLNAKYPYRCLLLCHELIFNLFWRKCPEHWYYNYSKLHPPTALITTEQQSKAAADFLLPILERLYQSGIATIVDKKETIGYLMFRLLVNAGRCDEAEKIFHNRSYGAVDLSDFDMGTLEMRRKNFNKAGEYFLKCGRYGNAVYAYYLAGNHEQAYNIGKNQKPIFTPYYAEEFVIWVSLLEKFESSAAAWKWYCDLQKHIENTKNNFLKNRLFNIGLNKIAARALDRLRKHQGQNIMFYSAREVFQPLIKYTVYFQSIGNMPDNETKSAAEILKNELGLTVKVLPIQPAPVAGVYDSGHHAFLADKLERAVRYAYGEKMPADAILFYVLTSESLRSNGINVLFNTYPDFGMATFSRMFIAGYKIDNARLIAVIAARNILYNTMSEKRFCNNYPCMFAAISHFERLHELDFKLCSACLEHAKKGNVKRALRRTGNRSYLSHFSDQEKKLFDNYKEVWK